MRKDWINLNGPWSFCLDPGKSGEERRLFESKGFNRQIIVPFCPESQLSGVGHTDFIEALWYHRTITIPAAWARRDVLLHFGGVDYECELFVDGQSVGVHFGGTVSFSFDITRYVSAGHTHQVVLRVADNLRTCKQPSGKQSLTYQSEGCQYTRTTGIWQTVWLEPVTRHGLKDVQIVPDLDGGRFVITPRFRAMARGQTLRVVAKAGAKIVAQATVPALDGAPLILTVKNPKSWSPAAPFLYDIILEMRTRHRTIHASRLQRRPASPESIRRMVPLLGGSPRLSDVGRVFQLGQRPQRSGLNTPVFERMAGNSGG